MGAVALHCMHASLRMRDGFAGMPSSLWSEENVETLVDALSRMRGAALKIGQMLSIQDNGMLPPAVVEIFDRVRSRAYYMPEWQTKVSARARTTMHDEERSVAHGRGCVGHRGRRDSLCHVRVDAHCRGVHWAGARGASPGARRTGDTQPGCDQNPVPRG